MNKKKVICLDARKTAIAEEILTDLLDFITCGCFLTETESATKFKDGRLESAIEEETIAKPIILEWIEVSEVAKKYGVTVEVPNIRNWTDVNLMCKELKIFIPCNIKISNFKQADNLNCQAGLCLATTGIYESTLKNPFPTQSEYLYKKIKETRVHKYNQPIDYYFIVFNKNDLSQSYYTSLLTIKELKPNGKNKLQANWGDNRKLGRYSLIPVTDAMIRSDLDRGLVPREYRSYDLAVAYVMEVHNECIDKAKVSLDYEKKAYTMMAKKAIGAYGGLTE